MLIRADHEYSPAKVNTSSTVSGNPVAKPEGPIKDKVQKRQCDLSACCDVLPLFTLESSVLVCRTIIDEARTQPCDQGRTSIVEVQ